MPNPRLPQRARTARYRTVSRSHGVANGAPRHGCADAWKEIDIKGGRFVGGAGGVLTGARPETACFIGHSSPLEGEDKPKILLSLTSVLSLKTEDDDGSRLNVYGRSITKMTGPAWQVHTNVHAR